MQARELKVVLETSVIYNAGGHELVRDEVGKLIKSSSNHKDLAITWHLPEIVKNEREHQLRQDALKDLPTLQRLERVLGSDFGLSEQTLIERVRERVNDHVKDLKLQILPVDAQGVDWNKIMSDAAFREPPFSPGKSEKGFRDALIVEAVGQLIASSPLDCRIAVVSSDKLMTEALVKKSIAAQNVHLLSSIEELKGLINTLVSNVDEAFIEQMKAVAASFFYEPGDRESYIYKQEITKRILRDFASLIFAIPPDQNEVERDKTLVSRPRFREKVGDRMFWVSRIAIRMKAFNESSSSVITTSTPAFGYSGFSGYSGFAGC